MDQIEISDNELVESCLKGNKKHLETLISRHNDYIFSICYKMLWNVDDSKDLTQDILIAIVTNLKSFRFNSSFKTWVYRIAVNHTLNFLKSRKRNQLFSFRQYGENLDQSPDADLPSHAYNSIENELIYEEVKQTCMSGMLMCLDNTNRVVFIIGEILGFNDRIGSQIVGISQENFRMKLSRAKNDLYNFMNSKCGLVNKNNPCRCSKKTKSFIEAGYVNPQNLLFFPKYKRMIEHSSRDKQLELEESFYVTCRELFQNHSLLSDKEIATELNRILSIPEVKLLFDLN